MKQKSKQTLKNASKQISKQISKQTYYLIAGVVIFFCLVFLNVPEQANQTGQTNPTGYGLGTLTGAFSMVEIAPKSFVASSPDLG